MLVNLFLAAYKNMPLSIAEYLGQRTDIETQNIIPTSLEGRPVPTCPFSGGACTKLDNTKPNHPVCSVRMNGEVFIVCSNRLIPAQATNVTSLHISSLNSIAQCIFPGVSARNVGYRRQLGVSGLFLDYVLRVKNPSSELKPNKVILEVQGGGETSSTGTITRVIEKWISQENPTNEFISKQLNAKNIREIFDGQKQNSPGIIPNNAWKRQLDQIVKKTPIAMHFGGGFAIVVGQLLYKYITSKSVKIRQSYFDEWEVAIIGVKEDEYLPKAPGPIPITVVSNSTFMLFSDFMAAIQDFDINDEMASPFNGEYTALDNSRFLLS